MITFKSSKNIKEYEPLFYGLYEDFGYYHWDSILRWCKVLTDRKDEKGYWKVWLIKENDKTIGMCGLYSLDEEKTDELWLGWFGIIPEKRSKGVGEKSIEFMVEKAKKVKCKNILSYVGFDNYRGIKFYNRNGFKIVSNVFDFGIKNNITEDSLKENFGDLNDFVIKREIKWK